MSVAEYFNSRMKGKAVMGETIGPDANYMQDKLSADDDFVPNCSDIGPVNDAYFAEKADHVLAAAKGGVNRVVSTHNMAYKAHEYRGQSGLIGASCLKCGQLAQHPIHDIANLEPKPWPAGKLRVQAIKDANMIRIEVTNPPTNEAERILMDTLPAVLAKFLEKNKDYGDGDEMRCLGAKAEFVRLWNKAAKLKRALWDGEPLAGEQSDEIMSDMIGHLLLALNRAEG